MISQLLRQVPIKLKQNVLFKTLFIDKNFLNNFHKLFDHWWSQWSLHSVKLYNLKMSDKNSEWVHDAIPMDKKEVDRLAKEQEKKKSSVNSATTSQQSAENPKKKSLCVIFW